MTVAVMVAVAVAAREAGEGGAALEMAWKDLYSRHDLDRRRKWWDSACFARIVGGTNNRRWTVIMAFPLAAFNLLSGRYRQENCESALSFSVR